ncbi:phosphoribosylformylglycinamidine cyclo-ligase [bacterium]|nr:MAG: phosphoribosylformylglycinamidine cyclo-ligase [bacterium]
MDNKITYSKAGVDIDSADESKREIANLAQRTFSPDVLTDIGLFAGAYRLDDKKILLSSTDGVGTKILVAIRANIYNTVGIDLVHHCVNDIAVHNAEPLFLLDYIGHTDLSPSEIVQIVEGLSTGCKNAGCALIGGETAQMPGFYPSKVFDLTATIVGITESDNIITGEDITPGDMIIGIPANGLHTNGYSLARYVLFERKKYDVDTYIEELGETIGEALLRTHRLYLSAVRKLRGKLKIKGMAHITGGGIVGNLVRVLPENTRAIIKKKNIPTIPIFEFIKQAGNIHSDEMYRTFNMGIGYVIIVSQEQLDNALELLQEYNAFYCGEVVEGTRGVQLV